MDRYRKKSERSERWKEGMVYVGRTLTKLFLFYIVFCIVFVVVVLIKKASLFDLKSSSPHF